MDREHQQAADRLADYQQEMRNKIEEASRQLEEAKNRLQKTSSKKSIVDDEDDDNEGGDYNNKKDVGNAYKTNINRSNNQEEKYPNNSRKQLINDEEKDWDGHLSPYSSRENSDDENDPQTQSHVEVSLLESHLNVGLIQTNQTIIEYNVSEPSSDDENENEKNNELKYNSLEVIEISSTALLSSS